MYWTVEPDRGRVVEVEGPTGRAFARETDRFLVVRWANGVGTIEVDCPSQSSARSERRRLVGEPVRTARQLDPVAESERRYDHKWDGDQLSLLVD